MRIVIVSDIHGNLEALEALPDDYDELWVLGDLVNYGPDPGGVIEYVQRRASLVVRGNHDHAVAFREDPRCSPGFREMAAATNVFTQSVLSAAQKAYLAELPLTATRTVDSVRFLLCHATPSDPLYRYSPQDSAAWQTEVQFAEADAILAGHTHLPCLFEAGGGLVINPGSLGQPKHGNPRASYAVWEDGKASLRQFEYPVEETIRKIQAMPVPEHIRTQLGEILLRGGAGRRHSGAASCGALFPLL